MRFAVRAGICTALSGVLRSVCVWRVALWLGMLVSLVLLPAAYCLNTADALSESSLTGSGLTFVQITDAHLFDEGKRADTAEEANKLRTDDWNAFRWAISKTNELIDAGRQIEFVVFTGDLGLEFVRSDGGKPCFDDKQGKENQYKQIQQRGWPELYYPAAAAALVAKELRRLKVKTIYILPGNNDLACESPGDIDGYRDFVDRTAKLLSGSSPHLIDLADSRITAKYGPFHLLGFNSASFKKLTNYRDFCAINNRPGCPVSELNQLKAAVRDEGALYLVFTHIPDLLDPGAPKNADSRDCDPLPENPKDAWLNFGAEKLPDSKKNSQERDDWNSVARNPRVIGIFAGHLHSCSRSFYAGSHEALVRKDDASVAVAMKTWVAPPLAIKFQENKTTTARGFLLAWIQPNRTGNDARVSVIPFWYSGTKEAPSKAPHIFMLCVSIVVFLAACTLALWFSTGFRRVAFCLLAAWSFGHIFVDADLVWRIYKGLQTSSFQWDTLLIAIGDVAAIPFIWMWLTLFRGTERIRPTELSEMSDASDANESVEVFKSSEANKPTGFLRIFIEILAVCAVVISTDLFLSYEYPVWQLIPSAILNIVMLGVALIALMARYKGQNIPAIIAMIAYSLVKVPAYSYATTGAAGPETWLYFALGSCEIIIFVLAALLIQIGRLQKRPEKELFTTERTIALAALLIAVMEKWDILRETPILLLTTILVPTIAVILAYKDKASKNI